MNKKVKTIFAVILALLMILSLMASMIPMAHAVSEDEIEALKAERDKIAAEAAANVARIQAEAEKDVLQIQADAAEYAGKKDAAINGALRASLDETLINYYSIKQWDGKLPAYYVAGVEGVLPILGSLPTDAAEGAGQAQETTEATE